MSLRSQVEAAWTEFNLATMFHDAWKPTAYDEETLGPTAHKPRPVMARHAAVKAWIAQRQGQRIHPVDAPAYRIGGRTVRQPFHELKQGHERQAPGCFSGLTELGEQGGEALVV